MLGGVLERVGVVEVGSGWEGGYPVQLLLFYLWQY